MTLSHTSFIQAVENVGVVSIPIRRSNPANIAADLRTFFVTSSIAEKRRLLQSERSARLFIDVLYHYRLQKKILLHDFVIMPDHFHVLVTLDTNISIERAVQFIKGGFAFRAGSNSDLNRQFGSEDFQKCEFISLITSAGLRNTSHRIRSEPAWHNALAIIRFRLRTRDFSLTMSLRG